MARKYTKRIEKSQQSCRVANIGSTGGPCGRIDGIGGHAATGGPPGTNGAYIYIYLHVLVLNILLVRYAQTGDDVESQVFEGEVDVLPVFVFFCIPLTIGILLSVVLSTIVWCIRVSMWYLRRCVPIAQYILFLILLTFF